jgi:hypothetical protein
MHIRCQHCLCALALAGVAALASDKEHLWVACEDTSVLIFHKPTQSWVGYFKTPCIITAFAFSGSSAWLGGAGRLLRVEKNRLFPTEIELAFK